MCISFDTIWNNLFRFERKGYIQLKKWVYKVKRNSYIDSPKKISPIGCETLHKLKINIFYEYILVVFKYLF